MNLFVANSVWGLKAITSASGSETKPNEEHISYKYSVLKYIQHYNLLELSCSIAMCFSCAYMKNFNLSASAILRPHDVACNLYDTTSSTIS